MSIEEQLTEATAKVSAFEAEIKAGAELLNESQAKLVAAEKAVADANADLAKANETLAAFELEVKTSVEAREAIVSSKDAELKALSAEIEKLKADAKTAEQIAAERYGAGNVPAKVSASEVSNEGEDLRSKFESISDPSEQTAFWRGLSSAQKTALLNATKGA